MREKSWKESKRFGAAALLAAMLIGTLGVLGSAGGAAKAAAQRPNQSKDQGSPDRSREMGFHAAELVSAGDIFIPITSVANGLTILDATVGKDGTVTDVDVVRDLPSATEPSITAIRKWEFSAGRLDGKPIESHVTVGVVFNWNKDKITLPPVESIDNDGKPKAAAPFEPAQITAAEFPGGFLPMTYAGTPVTVILQAVVAADGSLSYTKVVRDLTGKTADALKAMDGWAFKPAKLAGKSVRSVVIVAFAFRAYPQNGN
ncbi:MAG TPA: energy transducer TonB [Candidatus Acidoferrum sp.]|nr:energy transducer TonB [Candidatus Acidoferrum sp.]